MDYVSLALIIGKPLGTIFSSRIYLALSKCHLKPVSQYNAIPCIALLQSLHRILLQTIVEWWHKVLCRIVNVKTRAQCYWNDGITELRVYHTKMTAMRKNTNTTITEQKSVGFYTLHYSRKF